MDSSLRRSQTSAASQRYKQRHNIPQPRQRNYNNNNRKVTKKKKNKFVAPVTREELEAPKSFIIIRGRVTKFCKFLRDDLRLVFSPYTAAKLKEKQSNSLKDFVVSSTEFGVTHVITLSQSDIAGTMLRMIRLPKGPTFWFQVKQYSLIQDILKMQHKNRRWNRMKDNKASNFLPKHIQFAFRFAPLVILNGFSAQSKAPETAKDEKFNRATPYHKQLMSVMFKHMFCPINVISMKLNQCKRVVFLNYDSVNDAVQLRHYKIQIASDLKGISKGIKKIVRAHKGNRGSKKSEDRDKYLDLSKYSDITDIVLENKDRYLSESEVGYDENTKVVLEKIKKMNKKQSGSNSDASYVRLREIGPRIDMELVKIEELINDGQVLFHRYVNKTREENQQLQVQKDMEKKLKQKRRIKQMYDVKHKQDLKKEKSNKRIEDRKQREVEKLIKSFETDTNEKEKDNKVGEKKRGILKNKKRNKSNNDGPSRKKRKFNQKGVKFDS